MPTDTTAATPVVTYDRADERFKTVPLKWPFTVDGVRYDSVTIRRMTTGDVDRWVKSLPTGGTQWPPMFKEPADIVALIDAEDGEAIDAVVQDFLPPRFRTASTSTDASA